MTTRQHIAIGVDQKEKIWSGHFGIAPVYHIYNQQGELVEQRANPYGAGQGQAKHHDNPQLIVDLLPDCNVFIARRMGDGSKRKLIMELGIIPMLTDETEPEAALRAYLLSLG